jgi:uncharacterized membrane protein
MLALILYAMLGLVVLLVIFGFILPSKITVMHSVTIDKPVEVIFPWVADLKLWPQWTVWNATEDSTLSYTYPGPTTGAGGAMHWTAKKMGDGSLTFTEFQPNQALRYELLMPAHGTRVQGNIEFESAGGGATGVTWYDEVNLGANPFKHLLGPVLKKMLGRAFARSLAGLKKAAMTGQASGPGPK